MHTVPKAIDKRGLFTIREAADVISVDPYSVWRWVRAKRLKAVRKGRRWLIPASEAKRKFENRKVVMNMPTKRELEDRVEELEEKLSEARGIIDEALGLESDEDDDDDDD